MVWHIGVLYRIPAFLNFLLDENILLTKLKSEIKRFHGVKLELLLNVVNTCKYIDLNNNQRIIVTKLGKELINNDVSENQLKNIIKLLIEKNPPAWAAFFIQGRKAFIKYAPPEVVQCFKESGLLNSMENEDIDWWDSIAGIYRTESDMEKKETGRIGEKFTFDLEKQRTGFKPYWIALDFEQAGYDIVSKVSKENKENLLIEVKTTKQDWNKAKFYVSKNEWDVLLTNTNVIIHLWCIHNNSKKFTKLNKKDLEPYVPKNQKYGQWETFSIEYSHFKQRSFS